MEEKIKPEQIIALLALGLFIIAFFIGAWVGYDHGTRQVESFDNIGGCRGIAENTTEAIKIPGTNLTALVYFVEDGYYYADIDDIQ